VAAAVIVANSPWDRQDCQLGRERTLHDQARDSVSSVTEETAAVIKSDHLLVISQLSVKCILRNSELLFYESTPRQITRKPHHIST